jgi:hypothetical protein
MLESFTFCVGGASDEPPFPVCENNLDDTDDEDHWTGGASEEPPFPACDLNDVDDVATFRAAGASDEPPFPAFDDPCVVPHLEYSGGAPEGPRIPD